MFEEIVFRRKSLHKTQNRVVCDTGFDFMASNCATDQHVLILHVVLLLCRCTVLHKCDDESGCCAHEGHECAPKRQQAVQLFFFATFRNMTRAIETVTLSNHTECECRPINHQPRSHAQSLDLESLIKDVLGSDHSEVIATQSPATTSRPTTTASPVTPLTLPPVIDESLQLIDTSDIATDHSAGNESLLCAHMKCPAPFEARKVTRYPLRCGCECVDESNTRCLRIQKGLQRLSGHGATCVRRGHCQEPSCEHAGSFDRMKGMCPQKGDGPSVPRHHHKKQYGYERD